MFHVGVCWLCLLLVSSVVFVARWSLRVDWCLTCVVRCSGFVVGSWLLVGACCLVVFVVVDAFGCCMLCVVCVVRLLCVVLWFVVCCPVPLCYV